MELDKKVFFDIIREKLFKTLTTSQVEGIEFLLSEMQKNGWSDKNHISYVLATVYHETGRTMRPISENGSDGYFFRMYDKNGERPRVAADLGNIETGDGVRFKGRGYVQITGRRNYADWSRRLKLDLVNHPDFALDKDVAAVILLEGMRLGTFTGKKLSDYFNSQVNDPFNARKIVNRLDKAEEIVAYHRVFLEALETAEVKGPEVLEEESLKARISRIELILEKLKEAVNGV